MLYFSIIYSLTISSVLVFNVTHWSLSVENNIESDKALEIYNCTSKTVAQRMGKNKFKKVKMIITASKAAPGICQIKN